MLVRIKYRGLSLDSLKTQLDPQSPMLVGFTELEHLCYSYEYAIEVWSKQMYLSRKAGNQPLTYFKVQWMLHFVVVARVSV